MFMPRNQASDNALQRQTPGFFGRHRLRVFVCQRVRRTRPECECGPRPTSAAALAEAAVKAHQAAAEERGLQLRTSSSLLDDEVMADPERIALVFTDLITNALRCTPRNGEVWIGAQQANGSVRFAVTDTGVGILQG